MSGLRFIIAGASTSGKSTFAKELVERHHLQHVQIDPIIEAFEDVFPELGITHDAQSISKHEEVCSRFKPFLFRMIDGLRFDSFVIEGFKMPIADLFAKYGRTHRLLVFGYPYATIEEKVAACRKHDVNSWTNELDDVDLERTFNFLIAQSQREHDLCQKLGIPFVDTSKDHVKNLSSVLERYAL